MKFLTVAIPSLFAFFVGHSVLAAESKSCVVVPYLMPQDDDLPTAYTAYCNWTDKIVARQSTVAIFGKVSAQKRAEMKNQIDAQLSHYGLGKVAQVNDFAIYSNGTDQVSNYCLIYGSTHKVKCTEGSILMTNLLVQEPLDQIFNQNGFAEIAKFPSVFGHSLTLYAK